MNVLQNPTRSVTPKERSDKPDPVPTSPKDLRQPDSDATSEALHQLSCRLGDSNFYQQVRAKFNNNTPAWMMGHGPQQLAELPVGDRIAYLAYASLDARVTPSMVEKHYFTLYPQDVHIITTLFNENLGRPTTSSEHCLYSVSIKQISESMQSVKEHHVKEHHFRQYRDMYERRNRVSDKLLPKEEPTLQTFGTAGEDVMKVLRIAGDMSLRGGDHFLDTRSMFGTAFKELPVYRQSQLLRCLVEELHFSLVFHEAFNSVFTVEFVREQNRQKNRFGFMDPAHSMLFGTEHGNSVFQQSRDYFDEHMDSTGSTGGSVEEYPYHRMLLATFEKLREMGLNSGEQLDSEARRKHCDFLIEFWDKNRNPIFGAAVAEALSVQDPRYAAAGLMILLRSTEGYRNHLASVLYRLELGQVAISSEGLTYMQRLYDLREFNNPQYFVQRLTSMGDMGIFDSSKSLLRYFNLGDLTSADEVITPELLDFTAKTLFYGDGADSPKQRAEREKWVREFSEKYLITFNEQFVQQTGVRFNNLTFKEQGGFLHFIANAADNDRQRAMDLVAKFGEAGLRSFVSLQHGEHISTSIFRIAETLPLPEAQAVFHRYSAMMDSIRHIESVIEEQFGKERDISQADIDEISADLMQRATRMLLDFCEILDNQERHVHQQSFKALVESLDVMHRDTAIIASCIKVSKEKGWSFTLADARDFCMEIRPTGGLSEAEKHSILKVSRLQSFKTYKHDYAELVVGELERGLKAPQGTLYLLRLGEHLLALCRSAPHVQRGEEFVYVGSLNSNPVTSGVDVGLSLFGTVCEELSDQNLLGYVGPNRPRLVQLYQRKFGFKAVGKEADGTVVIQRSKQPQYRTFQPL